MKSYSFLAALGLLALASCGGTATSADSSTGIADVKIEADNDTAGGQLPYLGATQQAAQPGQDPAATAKPVPAFRLRDQDGRLITNQSLAGKVYITDFFFATCPGICPKMQGELLKVYQQYAQNPRVVFLSHTIDPDHDTQPVLSDYARRLGAAPGGNWRFARTRRDSAYALAHAYLTAAKPDAQAPGGIAHSGAFALVDDRGFVRGIYDGLNPQQTQQLLHDLPVLLAEVGTRAGQPATARR